MKTNTGVLHMAMAAGLVLTLIVTAAAQEPQQPQEQPQRPKVDPLKADQAFPNDPVAILLEASRLKALGRLDDALASYQQVLKLDSKNFEAHLGAGTVYDLKGNYADARRELDQAINAAPDNAREQRDQALTAMAVSYAFEGDIENAKSYYEKLYDFQVSTQRLDKAATTANSIGRAYLDAGDTRQAAQWYQTGQETVKKMSGLSSEDLDMWQMRFEHAQARIAARSGNAEEAETHAATMKTLIDKTVGSGVNGRAAAAVLGQSYQYLVGYDAFYAGKLDDAIAALQKADQHDPAVLGLIAEAYAKKGDLDNARVYADKVTGPPTHTLQSALMRREVKKIDELKPKEKDAKSKSDKPEKIEKTDKTENEAKKQP